MRLLDGPAPGAAEHRCALRAIARVVLLCTIVSAAGACDPLRRTTAPPEPPASVSLAAPELLSQPTDTSMTVSVVVAEPSESFVEAGLAADHGFSFRSPVANSAAGDVAVMRLEGLAPNTEYEFRTRIRRPGESSFETRPTGTFHTARPPGSSFVFTVQADSHLDERSSLPLYQEALSEVVEDRPDFHVDLGDTFMTEKHSEAFVAEVRTAPDAATVDARYLFERRNFAALGLSVPLVLVNGNHEGEAGWLLTGADDNVAIWAARARKRFFPNPTAGSFVSGPPQDVPLLGDRESVWAFTWGDVLIVGLDPFWWTADRRAGGENWGWTLGEDQYRWLESTLGASSARFKLVFLHNLVGGVDGAGRGGAEAAALYEWGGRSADGTRTFETHRPGWSRTIHELLVQAHVTAVFHGHDHLYARQELDGVVYQEVPQPSNPDGRNYLELAAAGGYVDGTLLGSAGYLRLTVTPAQLRCEYVRSWVSGVRDAVSNGEVSDSWTAEPWVGP